MNLEIKNEINYCAEVVKLGKPRKHSNADRLQCWLVFGSTNVITDMTSSEGELKIFFPIECQISEFYLSQNNCFRHEDLNADKVTKGYFESNRRVKAIKLRGEKSEGTLMPLSSLAIFGIDPSEFKEGDRFDTIDGKEICKKFIPRGTEVSNPNSKQGKKKKKEGSILIDSQFRFHIDTEQFKRNLSHYYPEDRVTITYKLHGTSGISSNILVKRRLNWFEKLLNKIGFRVGTTEYKDLWSSRTVIKTLQTESNHFYKEDIWKWAHDSLKNILPNGYTLYYEIVGYLPNSQSMIQNGYDYGNKEGEFSVYVYRGTYTGADGTCIEFSSDQLKAFCDRHGLNMVPILYQGPLNSILKWVDNKKWTKEERWEKLSLWRTSLLEKLMELYNEKDCYMCTNQVPEEGVVIRKERILPESIDVTKLKSFRFYETETKALDKGETNIEDEQALEENGN